MKHKFFKVTTGLIASLLVVVLTAGLVLANTESDLEEQKRKIRELETKLQEIQGEKQTISQTINYLSTRISLTESQIQGTETEIRILQQEIQDLSGKIDVLNVSLDKLTTLLINRINASYRNSFTQPFTLLMVSDGFSDFFRRYKYLKASQQHDRDVILALEAARNDFDNQKSLKENKQEEVVALQQQLKIQQDSLAQQQREREAALAVTRNNERSFQQQLARARAELEAIQSIIAGRGDETLVGQVKEGDVIANVIPTASTCSTGPHLHFEVAKDGVHLNPANYLRNKSVVWSNGPDGPFSFNGSWRWPLNDPVRITQGYGMTFYASTLRYYGGAPHTGIDMTSSSNWRVMAVQDGELYRGAIACGGGLLRYVRVKHSDGISTYYLHVNY